MHARRGQTILEYTIIVGIVAVVLTIMGVGIKRGLQSVVKVTADQIGNQQNSDQDFNDAIQGYMNGSNSVTNETSIKQVSDMFYVTNTAYNDTTLTTENTITNGGFSQSN